MANEQLNKDLLDLLAKHGVGSLPQATTAGPKLGGAGSPVASYIREIITGDQAFDERVLQNVARVLQKGTGG
jgi:hypothetical protein